MAIVVDPTTPKANTHHIRLVRGANELGLILADQGGNADYKAIDRQPYPRSALKIATGESKYTDLEPPFETTTIDDWSGGRGKLYWDDEKNRFFDSYRIDTTRPGKVFPAGLESFVGLYPGVNNYHRLSNKTLTKIGNTNGIYSATRFVADATTTFDYVLLPLRPVGTVQPLTIAIYSHNAGTGKPNALLYSEAITTVSYKTRIDSIMTWPVPFSPAISLTSGTTYWLVTVCPTATASNYWETIYGKRANSAVGDFMYSGDGITWDDGPPGNELTYGQLFTLSNHNRFYRKIFEYKRALYVVYSSLDYYDAGGTYSIYQLGDRGAADSNSADKTKLNDATKSWATDEWRGCTVLITAGPGEGEYRTITSNTATAITVATWNETHTTATEYVILGSKKLRFVGNTTYPVTDVAIGGDWAYLARGEGYPILRWRAYNNGGTWVDYDTDSDTYGAKHLVAVYSPESNAVLYGAENRNLSYGTHVWRSKVPSEWTDLFTMVGSLVENDKPWDGMYSANVLHSLSGVYRINILSGFTTGFAAYRDLDAPVDITAGSILRFNVRSSAATSLGDLRLILHDSPNCGQILRPPDAIYHFDGTTFTEQPFLREFARHKEVTVELATNKTLLIGSDEPFNRIFVEIASTPNAIAAVMSVVPLDDPTPVDTLTADATAVGGVTLAQDGTMTFTMPDQWKPTYINGIYKYWVRLVPSTALTTGLKLYSISIRKDDYTILLIPALAANTETWVSLTYSPGQVPSPNDRAIKSIGLYVNTDLGAMTVDFYSPIYISRNMQERIEIPNDTYITGLDSYAGGDEQRARCWVLTQDRVYEIQDMEGVPQAVPLALGEMSGLLHPTNGRAHCVNGVYLYFNMFDRIQRYYNRQLEDIGPTRDNGLPAMLTGPVKKLISVPGAVIALVGSDNTFYKTHSVLMYSGGGWHNLYTHYEEHCESFDVHYQTIPGRDAGELWISIGGDLLSINLALSPNAKDYKPAGESWIVMPRIYMGLLDVDKFFKSIKASMQSTKYYSVGVINIEYKTNNVSTWTPVAGAFDVDGIKEQLISSAYDIAGKWIQLRVRLFMTSHEEQSVVITEEEMGGFPELNALILESLSRVPVKWAYTLVFRVKDRDIDLLGDEQPDTVDSVDSQLSSWVASPLPIRLYAFMTPYNDKWVYVEPSSLKLLRYQVDEDGRREMIAQITLIEI